MSPPILGNHHILEPNPKHQGPEPCLSPECSGPINRSPKLDMEFDQTRQIPPMCLDPPRCVRHCIYKCPNYCPKTDQKNSFVGPQNGDPFFLSASALANLNNWVAVNELKLNYPQYGHIVRGFRDYSN